MNDGRITVIGLDGGPLPGRARERLGTATLVVGGRRHFPQVGEAVPAGTRTHVLREDVTAALDQIEAAGGPVVVLASGDPGFFGVVRLLAARFGPAALEVLPGVSSVSMAFARAGLPWDDAVVVSAHGRDLAPALAVARSHPKVAVLTSATNGPAAVGRALAGTGRTLVVAERLGEPGERVVRCTPDEAAGADGWAEPNVVLVLDEQQAVPAAKGWSWPRRLDTTGPADGWALPETAFAHRDAMITKSEVRALALARLAPSPGSTVWDVGAGSGSVAVECARLGADAYAVDRDADACGLARANAAALGVRVTVVEGSAPAALAGLPMPDAVFIGGGGLDAVRAVAGRGPRRVVVALATVERVGAVIETLSLGGYDVDGVLLSAARLAPLGPAGGHRLAPVNPVLLVWGVVP